MAKTLATVLTILFFAVSAVPAVAAEKSEDPATCQACGMSRAAGARNRMLIAYADGTTIGTCSLHCAATLMRVNNARLIASIKVADYTTGRLIDARTASWVIGSKKSGVMSSAAKLAFASRQEAQSFVERTGGVITTFDQALNLARMEGVLDHKP